jgi:multisite-specific tRNA:(cytosine-C5)-methyltransferase
LQVRDRGSWFGVHEDVPHYRKNVILPSMFPSGNGSKDICIVRSSSLEMNTDVVDANMKDSPDIGGEQETKVSSDGGNNNDNPNTEARTEIDCDSGEATNSSKKLNSTSIRTDHSDCPLHHCMRIVPHDQNSGAFFIAVLHKLSPLNGSALTSLLFCIFLCLVHQTSCIIATAS